MVDAGVRNPAVGINIPGEGTRGRSIALPELSSLGKESTNTYFGELRGCRGGCGDYPPVKADSTEDAAGTADRGSHPARVPARGRRAPRDGPFAQDKGEGGGCPERASCHALTGNS